MTPRAQKVTVLIVAGLFIVITFVLFASVNVQVYIPGETPKTVLDYNPR